jgi:hypothetical protein
MEIQGFAAPSYLSPQFRHLASEFDGFGPIWSVSDMV